MTVKLFTFIILKYIITTLFIDIYLRVSVLLINSNSNCDSKMLARYQHGKKLDVLLYTAGAISISLSITSCIKIIWRYFLKPSPNIKLLYNTNDILTKNNINTWVIITGGSEGIGLELSKIYAKQGMNIVLIARDINKLENARNEILSLYSNIEVKIFSLDASKCNENDYKNFKEFIENDHISILVNNVGVHNDIPEYVVNMKSHEVRRIINVNCTFQVEFTSLIIPLLRRTALITKRKPLIMNISSLTSKMAMPMLSTYAATKAFEEHFSLSLAAELAPDRIDVICLRPGITVSKMSGISKPSFFCPSAKDMAKKCIDSINKNNYDVSIVPYFPHCLLDFINTFIPQQLAWGIVREIHQVKRELVLNEKKTTI